jgi:hypothetical protein
MAFRGKKTKAACRFFARSKSSMQHGHQLSNIHSIGVTEWVQTRSFHHIFEPLPAEWNLLVFSLVEVQNRPGFYILVSKAKKLVALEELIYIEELKFETSDWGLKEI